jgi:hypothetical protein
MNPDEIRTEIERRKKIADDMKLSQKVWSLYNSNFQYIDDGHKKDPELILQEVRQSLVRASESSEFRFKDQAYTLICRHGKDENDRFGGDDSRTTPMNFKLKFNGDLVFEFDMRRIVTYGRDGPDFYESFGNISAFIEGPWVADIEELDRAMWAHRQQVYKQRNAPKEAARLKQDMKKFGL